jgi:hypothetical protein
MRTVVCSGLGRDVSALGFGCASLGSRISEAQGRRALDYAFERGVSWYDVAPPDGGGEAETILGKFLVGRRDRVAICTKVGIARPMLSPLMRIMTVIKRGALRAFPELWTAVDAGSKSNRIREPLRGDLIESSLAESLRRLRTDYVDVLALQEPRAEDFADPTILAALRRVVEKGYVRCLSIVGEPDAVTAGVASGLFRIVQCRDNPFHQTIDAVRSRLSGDPSFFFVTQNAFGTGAHERLSHLLVGDGGRLGALASQLAYGPPFMASEILLDYAFGNNPAGVVVASMSHQAHIDANCARASRAPRTDVVEFVNKTMLTSPANKLARYV